MSRLQCHSSTVTKIQKSGYKVQNKCHFGSLSLPHGHSSHFSACTKTRHPLALRFLFFSTRFYEVPLRKGGRRVFCLPPSPLPPLPLPLLPLSGIRLHFEGERRHASRTRTSGGNKQGQIHQTEGVARQHGERWVLIKVEQLNSF